MELDNEWENFINGLESAPELAEESCTKTGEAPECEDLYISTKTKLLYLNQKDIDVARIFWNVPIVEYWKPGEGVIKKQMKNVSEKDVKDFVLGMTIGNDVTVENCDDRDHHLLRSKGADNFCPLGPWIETDFMRDSWDIEAIQNGTIIRRGHTKNHFWQWPKILSRLSEWITLEPMDVILTGNPPAISPDKVISGPTEFVARIEGIGELKTYFV
jgi:hypothetical protein